MRAKYFAFMMAMLLCFSAEAADSRFGEGTRIVQRFQDANATCFLYANNQYKCACSNLKSSKKVAWFSQPAEYFNGQLSTETQYIFAQRCR